MAYRLSPDDTDLTRTLRRVACEQIDAALSRIEAEDGTTLAATVHDVRKRAKKLRGLLRLVRPALPAYQTENRVLRDAARTLSPLRDRGTLIEAYDALMDASDTPRQPYGALRGALTNAQKVVASDPDTMTVLHAVHDTLSKVRDRTGKWRLTDKDAPALAAGVEKTFARAAAAHATAQGHLTDDTLHDWRKRVKYHRYHARLLRPIWPEVMELHVAQAKRLEDLLGEHRDLTLLAAAARGLSQPADMSDRATLTGLAETRQKAILVEATPLSARLFAGDSGALSDRWRLWFKLCRKER